MNIQFYALSRLVRWLPFVIALIVVTFIICLVAVSDSWWRGIALSDVLSTVSQSESSEEALVAKVILDNHQEARQNASLWSGVYWTFMMVSAVLSAAAGLILKVESIITDDKVERHRNPLFRWCRAIDYALYKR